MMIQLLKSSYINKLFAGSHHYACGGYNDFVGSFQTVEKAIESANAKKPDGDFVNDWWHVVRHDEIVEDSHSYRSKH